MNSPAAVGHLVHAGPAAGRASAIERFLVAHPITGVDAWAADPFPMALAEVCRPPRRGPTSDEPSAPERIAN